MMTKTSSKQSFTQTQIQQPVESNLFGQGADSWPSTRGFTPFAFLPSQLLFFPIITMVGAKGKGGPLAEFCINVRMWIGKFAGLSN